MIHKGPLIDSSFSESTFCSVIDRKAAMHSKIGSRGGSPSKGSLVYKLNKIGR